MTNTAPNQSSLTEQFKTTAANGDVHQMFSTLMKIETTPQARQEVVNAYAAIIQDKAAAIKEIIPNSDELSAVMDITNSSIAITSMLTSLYSAMAQDGSGFHQRQGLAETFGTEAQNLRTKAKELYVQKPNTASVIATVATSFTEFATL